MMNSKLLNKIFRRVTHTLSAFYGKSKYQSLFKALYYMSLDGLNYGKVHSLEKDGELFLVKNLKKELAGTTSITLFDVGANEGAYTKMLLSVFKDENIDIHVFEPSSDTFSRLHSDLKTSNITFNNCGLSNKNEELVLYKSGLGSDYASIYESEKSDYTEVIRLTTLDEYCEQHSIKQIDFIKIDVEGHELKCLQGAETMLKEQRIQYIQFEFGISNIYSRVFFKDIYEQLDKYGYKISRMLKNGLAPIQQYHHSTEVFYTTNYFAQVKR